MLIGQLPVMKSGCSRKIGCLRRLVNGGSASYLVDIAVYIGHNVCYF